MFYLLLSRMLRLWVVEQQILFRSVMSWDYENVTLSKSSYGEAVFLDLALELHIRNEKYDKK
jgi:hypothetical protein